MRTDSNRLYRFGPFQLDTRRHQLLRDGRPVALTAKVFDLLLLLVESRGRLVTKEELISRLWPDQFVEESNLTQSVYLLRKALGARQEGAGYVETLRGRGYRFTAAVTQSEASGRLRQRGRPNPTIAILPFSPLPGAERNESLELGIAEALIIGLSRIRNLTVRQVGSVRKYADRPQNSLDASRELDVEAILKGTVQKSGERLRVTARLIRVEDESVLWAGKFDKPFTDIFSVQDSICEQVVSALAPRVARGFKGRLIARHTRDPEVHRLFLECRYHWHQWTPGDWKRSIERGRMAVSRDPSHAPSYSWMAASYCALGISGTIMPREAFGQATELVDKALGLDRDLPEAHEVKGAIELFHKWRWAAAERSLRRALELNPSCSGARNLYALLLIVTGQPEEALEEIRRAHEVDPLSLIVNTDFGNVLYYARRYDDAIEQLRHTLDLDPWFAHARFALGYAYLRKGRHQEAIAEIEAAVEYSGREKESSPDLAYAKAVSGDREGAERILQRLVQRSATGFVDPYFPALVHVGLGTPDDAFAWFKRAYAERSRELIYLRANPIFDHLHSDGRLTRLMKRIGI